jgi:autotransporter-associated beta strand protein
MIRIPKPSSVSPRWLLLALCAQHAAATPLNWSANGATQGGTGTWDTSTSRWGIAATGPYLLNWNNANNDTAIFGGTAGTVTLASPITLGGILFNTSGYTVAGNTLTLAATGMLSASQSATISSTLAGSVLITKSGVGTLTLNPSSATTFNAGLTISGGTLLADFANLASPANLISNSNALALGGGILSIKGKSSGVTTQTFAGVTINAGGGQILGNKNGGTSTTITLGALGMTTTGGSLLVGNATTTTGNAPVITTTTNKNATGIHGARAVFFTGTANTGYDWASTSSGSSPYTLSAYNSYTTLPTSGGSSTVNYNATASTTLTSGFSVNTLKFASGTAISQTIDLGGGALIVEGGGLLITGSTTGVGPKITNGTITAGNGSGSYDLIVHQFNNAGGITSGPHIETPAIAAAITDNGPNPVSLVKSGSGSLALLANNTYTGNTYINSGNLMLGAESNTGTLAGGNYSGNIIIATGANLCPYLTTAQTLSGVISGEGGIIKAFSGGLTLGNNNTYSGKTWLNVIKTNGGGTTTVTSFNSVNGGNPPLAGSSLGRPTTVGNGTIDIGGAAQGGVTLKYTGPGETTDRILNFIFNGNGATKSLDASGTGHLKFTSTFTASTALNNDFTLTGTGGGEITGGLPFTNGKFTKSGTGTWIIGDTVNTSLSTGTTSISTGTLVMRKGGFGSPGAMTVSANAALIYNASTDTPLNIAGSLAITGGTSTTLGASIGSTVDSAVINVVGNATTTAAAIKLNLHGNSFSTTGQGSDTYTLIRGGGTDTLNNATWSLGTVFNATNFTVGAIQKSTDAVTAAITQVPSLTTAWWKGTATSGITKIWAASNGSSDSNWSATSGGAVQSLVPGANTDVIVSSTSTTVPPVNTTLGSDMSIKSLTIADTANGLDLDAASRDSYALTIGTGGITMQTGVPASSIGTPVILGGSQTWTNHSTNALTISGAISGNGDLTKSGNGAAILSGFNSFDGDVSVSSGTLVFTKPTIPPGSTVTVSAGATLQLDYSGSTPVSYLILNGASLPAGTYNNTNAAPYLTGAGSVTVTITDSDVDGIPDWWMIQNFGHPTGQAGDNSLAGDDADTDGLTNLREFRQGTDPKDSDTDNDGLADGPEIDTHSTNPLLADTDGDGLADGAEVNTHLTNPLLTDTDGDALWDGVEINTHNTNPLSPDTDNDGAGDWYEITASFTDPKLSSSKPNVIYPLPDPDNTPPANNKPVKVFIIMGQSNMEGKGAINPVTTKGTLARIVRTENKFPNLVDANNNWLARPDVKYRGVISAFGNGNLTVGQGTLSTQIGPELGFGNVLGYHFSEPVIVIKASLGGQDLGYDFMAPGSQRYDSGGKTYAGYHDTARSWTIGTTPPPPYVPGTPTGYLGNPAGGASNYGGKMFDDSVSQVNGILSNFASQYPAYAAQGYQIAGIGWFQGWNDSVTTTFPERYEQNMIRFINAFRSAVNAPNAPFVIATSAFSGWNASGGQLTVINAQLAAGNPANPNYPGNTKTMECRGYWRVASESPVPDGSQGYHYNHNSETMMLVGDALGRGMIDLLGTSTSAYETWAAGPFQSTLTNSAADFDFDGGGLETGIEWALGGDPTNPADDAGLTPVLDNSDPTYLIFTFNRADLANSDPKTTITVQYGSDLTGWTTAVDDNNNVEIETTNGSPKDTVTVKLKRSTLGASGKLFARLKVMLDP